MIMARKRPRPTVVVPESRVAASAPHAPSLAAPACAAIDLGAACTLHEAVALRSACLAALGASEPPVLDGSRVECVDSAGLQVLVAFTIDCMERSLNFRWRGRSPVLEQGIRRLGLEPLLDSPGMAAFPAGDAT